MQANDDILDLPGQSTLGSTIRAAAVVLAFTLLTVPTMVMQAGALKLFPSRAKTLPCKYHRMVCRLLGIRVHVEGLVVRDRPVLIVANHSSWLDIPVLSTLAPLSFIAKSEVDTWPFISWLSRLQQTIFIDRKSRADVGRVANKMAERFANGDTLVLFAEGTSSDGNRVLPFRSALLSPVFGKDCRGTQKAPSNIVVQTLSLAYTHLHGIPLGRDDRKTIAWYGNMEMLSHAWELLKAGPLDVHVSLSEPIAIEAYEDRKTLTRGVEQRVRSNLMRMLHGERIVS